MAERNLRINIVVDDAGAVQKITAVDAALDRTATTAKTKVSPAIDQATAQTQKLGIEAEKTARQVRAKESALSGLTSMLMRYAGPLALGMAVRRTMEWADGIEEMSRATGIGIERLQRLNFAATQNGTTFEQLVQAVGQLNNRLGSGDTSAIAAIHKLGLSFQALQRLSPDEQMLAIGDALGKLPAGAQQVTVAMDLFGRSGQRLIPVLTTLNEAMADAPVASDEAVRALGQLQDAYDRLKTHGTTLLAEVLWPIVAALNAISQIKGPQSGSIFGYLAGAYGATGVMNRQTAAAMSQAYAGLSPAMQNIFRGGLPTPPKPPELVTTPAAPSLDWYFEYRDQEETRAKKRKEQDERLQRLLDDWSEKTERVTSDITAMSRDVGRNMLTTMLGIASISGTGATATYPFLGWQLPTRNLGTTGAAGLYTLPPSVQGAMPGGGWGSALFGQGGIFANLPQQMLGAFMGGGNVARTGVMSAQEALARYALNAKQLTALQANIAQMATALGMSLVGGNAVASTIGGAATGAGIGATIGSMSGNPLGTGIGAGIGAGVGALAGYFARRKASKEIFPARADFIFQQTGLLESMGGWQALQQQAAAAGPGAMQAFEVFYKTADVKQFESALKRLSAALQTATQKTQLLADLEARAAGLRERLAAPGWEEMASLAGKYSLDPRYLGGTYTRGKAGDILSDYERFMQGGADQYQVLKAMAPSISALVQSGQPLPSNLRPLVQDIANAGWLLDEAGQKITDLLKIQWGDPVQTAAEILTSALDELTRQIAALNTTLGGTPATGGGSGGPGGGSGVGNRRVTRAGLSDTKLPVGGGVVINVAVDASGSIVNTEETVRRFTREIARQFPGALRAEGAV